MLKMETKICPKCKKSNFCIENNTSFLGGETGWYHCNNCGFESAIFPTIENKNEIRKVEIKDKKEIKNNQPIFKLSQIPISVFVILFGALSAPFLYFRNKLKKKRK